MTTIEQVFEYDAADINEAAIETDTTIVELLAEVQKLRKRPATTYSVNDADVMLWLDDSAECMLEWLEENRPKGKIEEATAEAEYRADQAHDEKWLREVTG